MSNGVKPNNFLKKNTQLILKISLGLCAVCYVLCYAGGLSEDPALMRVAFAVVCAANILPALL